MCIFQLIKNGYVDFLPYWFQFEMGKRWKFVGGTELEPDELYVAIGRLKADMTQWRHGCIRPTSLARRHSWFIPCKTFFFAYIPLEIEKETVSLVKIKRQEVWLSSQGSFYKLTHEETAQVFFDNFLRGLDLAK